MDLTETLNLKRGIFLHKILTFPVLILTSQLVIAQGGGCAGNAYFDDFDFWLGQWSVINNANGNHGGSNTITKELNNCLVMENWQGAAGSVGRSINQRFPSFSF